MIFVWVIAALCLSVATSMAANMTELRIDFSRTNGVVRALHGINRGPLVAGGMIDLTEAQRALGIPFTRVHDSHWPNSDVVDMHAVFPDPSRNPDLPESYDFPRTDAYLSAILRTGAQIVYRLGETIEHDDPKRFVHPPKDFDRWAQACLGIIRHYNEGWAGGFRHGIQYWEIWNEPENRPACWTGTDEQFLALYATAARRIKSQFPALKVGGPSFGYTGEVRGDELRAGGLLTNFLAFVRRESLPLDFLSWHCYTDDPRELMIRAVGIRTLLNAHGFTNTESHLNEWNYLPNKSWTPISKTRGTPESRRRAYGQMAGAPGAAFIVSALIQMQDAPVDMMNLFHGETGPFGLFDIHGVPEKNYLALRALAALQPTPYRVEARSRGAISLMAGLNERRTAAAVLLSHRGESKSEVQLICTGLGERAPWLAEVRVVDASHDFSLLSQVRIDGNQLHFVLQPNSVALVSLKP